MARLSQALIRLARRRAERRCEYCRMHQHLQGTAFHVEHYQPSSRGGPDDADNLVLACGLCNQRKSVRMTLRDPRTGTTVNIFNPRVQEWLDHFKWRGETIVGCTNAGQGMVDYFAFNSERRVFIRSAEARLVFHPPNDS